MKTMIQSISKSQEHVKELLTQRVELLLKVNQINSDVKDVNHKVSGVSESQDSIKNILKDLYDIINGVNRYDKNDPQDFKLLQKIDDISKRMTQVNLGQESVKEVMTELKSNLEGNSRSKKRGYYQTTDCATPNYEERTKQPKLSTKLNFAYLDRQYGDILEVSKNREVRRGLNE